MNSLTETLSKNTEPVALITGASGRIGAQTARRLHESGFKLAIHYRNSKHAAEQLQRELQEKRSDSVALFQADLNDIEVFPKLITAVLEKFQRLDVLINNASSFYPTPVNEMNETQWNDLVGSNMKAPLFLSQAAVPALKKSRGCIINLVDIHAFRPMKNHTIYCMAKAANVMMIKSLARELAPEIRVNGVAPGAIEWPDGDQADSATDHGKQEILSRIPLGRKGEFDHIAKTIRFLVLEAPYITGEIIKVDGGRSVQQ